MQTFILWAPEWPKVVWTIFSPLIKYCIESLVHPMHWGWNLWFLVWTSEYFAQFNFEVSMCTGSGLVCQPPSDHNVAMTTWCHLVAPYTRYLVQLFVCTINNIDLATWVFEGALTETDLRQQSRIYLGIHLSHETGAGPSPWYLQPLAGPLAEVDICCLLHQD